MLMITETLMVLDYSNAFLWTVIGFAAGVPIGYFQGVAEKKYRALRNRHDQPRTN